MPSTQPAPAVPGNQQPRPAPLTTPPSLRRPPPANRPRVPRPISSRPRAAKVPYPELPQTPGESGGRVTSAEFDRAYFLRCLSEVEGAEALLDKLYQRGGKESERPARLFLSGAIRKAQRELREEFARWMESCGGMAGPDFKPDTGSAA